MKPLVFFVDDHGEVLEQYQFIFQDEYEVRTALDQESAIKLAQSMERPAVLFLDFHLGRGQNGIEVLNRMHANARHPLVPFFLSGDGGAQADVLAVSGAVAYYVKPVDPKLIKACVDSVGQQIINTTTKAMRDPLTGLFNREGFTVAATHELAYAVRDNTETASVSVDMDNLKPINDTYGHEIGDMAIQHIVRHLKEHIGQRAIDLVSRIGGDEFVAVLPRTTLAQAQSIAQQLEVFVSESPIPVNDKDGAMKMISVTITTGTAVLSPHDIDQMNYERTLWELVRSSDAVMEEQKRKKKEKR